MPPDGRPRQPSQRRRRLPLAAWLAAAAAVAAYLNTLPAQFTFDDSFAVVGSRGGRQVCVASQRPAGLRFAALPPAVPAAPCRCLAVPCRAHPLPSPSPLASCTTATSLTAASRCACCFETTFGAVRREGHGWQLPHSFGDGSGRALRSLTVPGAACTALLPSIVLECRHATPRCAAAGGRTCGPPCHTSRTAR